MTAADIIAAHTEWDNTGGMCICENELWSGEHILAVLKAAGYEVVELPEPTRHTDNTAQWDGMYWSVDLIPAWPLRMLAKLYGVGAQKYAERNWERGYEWSKSFAALNRHLWAWWAGEDKDAETGIPHLACVAWHAFALLEFSVEHREFDDRPLPGHTNG